MSKHDVQEVPVLIVGAGPAGLITAATLARYGIESLLVERRPTLSRLPRANVASTWSMELLRAWGLEDEVRASAVDAEPRGWIAETLADPGGFEMPASFPSLEQSAAVSPSAPAVIGQDELEPIVLRHLRAVGTGEVRFGTQLVDVEITADGVRATIRDAVNGTEQQALAHYLVAGDGAHSRIRQILGIEMHGPGHVADAITAIFHAPLWDVVENRRYAIYPVSRPDPRGVFVAVSRKDRWVFGVTRDPGELDPAEFGKEAMARLIVEASGVPELKPRIERTGTFSYFAGVAERFREGPVLLAGDAAHRVTPRGATGMNAAIRDGYDLGWKLAWVLRGLGRGHVARHLRGRATSGRGAQRRPLVRPQRLAARRCRRAARRPRRPHRAPLVARGRRADLDLGPRRRRADAVHRSRRGRLRAGGRSRIRVGPGVRPRAASRRGARAGDRPGRLTARPTRRGTRRVVRNAPCAGIAPAANVYQCPQAPRTHAGRRTHPSARAA